MKPYKIITALSVLSASLIFGGCNTETDISDSITEHSNAFSDYSENSENTSEAVSESREGNSSVHDSSESSIHDASEDVDSSEGTGDNSENSGSTISGQSSVQESTVSSAVQSSDIESTVNPSSEISEPPVSEKTYIFSYDPINTRTITFDGNRIVYGGKIGEFGVRKISLDKIVVFNYEINGDHFTAEYISDTDWEPYVSLYCYDSNGMGEVYRLNWKNGVFDFPDSSEIVKTNQKAVDGTLTQPLKQVSEYVSEGSDPKKVREVLSEIKKLSDSICEGLDNDYDKLRAISRWVSDNISYDYAVFADGVPPKTITLEYVLETKATVCGGYSNMTAALCAAQGIKCYNVHGRVAKDNKCYAENGEDGIHEWNYAVIDGRKIWVDSGWNSHRYIYEDGRIENYTVGCKYFDTSDEIFAQDHKADYCEYRDFYALID